jgi:hypothetical protein
MDGPDEGDMHVVRFFVPDAHLTAILGAPFVDDGYYLITPKLTGNWLSPEVRMFSGLGFKKITPSKIGVALTKDAHIKEVEFEVVWSFWRFW